MIEIVEDLSKVLSAPVLVLAGEDVEAVDLLAELVLLLLLDLRERLLAEVLYLVRQCP